MLLFFFCQAEDGIRDGHVTGVQTCALPISGRRPRPDGPAAPDDLVRAQLGPRLSPPARTACRRRDLRRAAGAASTDPAVGGPAEIGRATCRDRVYSAGDGGA